MQKKNNNQRKAYSLAGLFALLVCGNVSSQTENETDLQEMAQLYPVYEQSLLSSLPPFGTYVSSVDTSLIVLYVNKVSQLLAKNTLSLEEKQFIQKIAECMTRGPIYRNGSADSRWRNYAKQAMVLTLCKSDIGRAILSSLIESNPHLEAEIEAYVLADELHDGSFLAFD